MIDDDSSEEDSRENKEKGGSLEGGRRSLGALKRLGSSQRLKRGIQFVEGSKRHLLEVSGQRIVPLTREEADHPEVARLRAYVEIHNEQSPHPIFEVGYWQEPFKFKDNNRRLCIGCKKCKHKIFPDNNKNKNNNKNATPEADGSGDDLFLNLEEETRILKDMEEHVTTHYMNTAKMILFLLETIFRVIINYYDQ